jgi:hypothetical protein
MKYVTYADAGVIAEEREFRLRNEYTNITCVGTVGIRSMGAVSICSEVSFDGVKNRSGVSSKSVFRIRKNFAGCTVFGRSCWAILV